MKEEGRCLLRMRGAFGLLSAGSRLEKLVETYRFCIDNGAMISHAGEPSSSLDPSPCCNVIFRSVES